MKLNKGLRIVFFIIIIILIIISIYIIYGKNKKEIVSVNNQKKNTDISYDFSIGITNYDTLNPILTNSKDCKYISKLIFNSLLKIDKDFSIKEDIAKEWSKLNNRCYIIKLKDNIFWHDGTKLTSEDVKFTVDEIKKIKTSSYYKDVEAIDNVEIIDDYTFKIFINDDIENFEYNMCFPIIAKHCYNQETMDLQSGNIIGTGEYKILFADENKIILTNDKNRNIVVNIYPTVTKMYNAFIKGKVDMIFTENYNYENYLGKIGYEKDISTGQKYGYIVINTEKIDKETRQAINYVINKNNIVYDIYRNKFKICNFPNDYKEYINFDQINVYEYNVNNEKKIKTDKILKLLVERNNSKLIEVANKIQEQLKECEINIDIIQYRKEDFEYLINLNNYDMILLEDNLDLNYNLDKYFGEDNFSNYNNDTINNLLKEVNSINDGQIIQEKYNKILEIYKEEMPFISLYYSCNIILHSTKLKGNFEHNWENLFYNIDSWYRIIK